MSSAIVGDINAQAVVHAAAQVAVARHLGATARAGIERNTAPGPEEHGWRCWVDVDMSTLSDDQFSQLVIAGRLAELKWAQGTPDSIDPPCSEHGPNWGDGFSISHVDSAVRIVQELWQDIELEVERLLASVEVSP
jgi:hypothetical protein